MARQLLLSLDYELFFGNKPGTVERCMIEPVESIVKVLDKYNAKLSLFVDAGFLCRLSKFSEKYPSLQNDYRKIAHQLSDLKKSGHDIQLHIHPHWEDSIYTDNNWNIVTKRYKLHDYNDEEILNIVHRYKQALTDIVGDSVFAYRAGGWCIQPFETISKALLAENIWLDSTVFWKGISEDTQRWYDFSLAPQKSYWRFSKDPQIVDTKGQFIEVPISSIRVNPLLFWKMLIMKKFTKEQHQVYGDGVSMSSNLHYYLKRLTSITYSVVSIDGLKSSLLNSAYSHFKRTGGEIFNVMGHPKTTTPFSLRQLDHFLSSHHDIKSITYQDLKFMRPA